MPDSTAPAGVADPGVRRVNGLSDARFRTELAQCLDVDRWVNALLRERPFADRAALVAAADAHARAITDDEAAAALARHPRIGERAPGADTAAGWSRAEQSGFARDEPAVREAFAAGQAEYERRFGRIYLVCASGLSGAELLDGLRERMGNSPAAEARVVADELRKIALLRVGKVADTP
ncbi:2-oxo-4-hydroxy-4-carboxy-5-ureidoimidazoline decarboxylase [Nocardiopsis mangrovi]|uniref:2-oxo-4-hydroxy-4-carboxy-5-ureidoimidazoline decarboxylase n=1 Tax=Nocardiopsis mangrovi TaxID=1179818 RepID=A0ABV9DPQ0_9ACTN